MRSLEHIAATLKAHEELCVAIEDFRHDMLNPTFQKKLKEAIEKSKELMKKE